MEHETPKITDVEIGRLKDLSKLLRGGRSPFTFNMAIFFEHGEDYSYTHDEREVYDKLAAKSNHGCGTHACALGHCPLIAGMELTEEDVQPNIGAIDWIAYGQRLFPSLYDGRHWNEMGEQIFAPQGARPGELCRLKDNTREKVADRIDILVANNS